MKTNTRLFVPEQKKWPKQGDRGGNEEKEERRARKGPGGDVFRTEQGSESTGQVSGPPVLSQEAKAASALVLPAAEGRTEMPWKGSSCCWSVREG